MYIHTKTPRSGARARDIKYSRVDARIRGATRGEYTLYGAHEKSTGLDFMSGSRIIRGYGTRSLLLREFALHTNDFVINISIGILVSSKYFFISFLYI